VVTPELDCPLTLPGVVSTVPHAIDGVAPDVAGRRADAVVRAAVPLNCGLGERRLDSTAARRISEATLLPTQTRQEAGREQLCESIALSKAWPSTGVPKMGQSNRSFGAFPWVALFFVDPDLARLTALKDGPADAKGSQGGERMNTPRPARHRIATEN
jgi:hypothetical protein